MSNVITYQLAHETTTVDLCDACADRDDHDCGSLGPVEHGLHRGSCQGKHHSARPTVGAVAKLDRIVGASLDWMRHRRDGAGCWVATVADRGTRTAAATALRASGIECSLSEGCVDEDDEGTLYLWAIVDSDE